MLKLTMSHLTQASRVAGAVLILLSLGLFYPGTVSNVNAQSPTKAKSSSPAGGPKEGIKVHGRWTIDIRSPDGKLVTHREFENALTDSGASSLSLFLRRIYQAGEWHVDVGGTNPPCIDDRPAPRGCWIFEPATQQDSSSLPNAFKTLTIGSVSSYDWNTVLAGTATAQRDGQINLVRTALSGCPIGSSACVSQLDSFTTATLATPINVVAGQIIQVKVVISFS